MPWFRCNQAYGYAIAYRLTIKIVKLEVDKRYRANQEEERILGKEY